MTGPPSFSKTFPSCSTHYKLKGLVGTKLREIAAGLTSIDTIDGLHPSLEGHKKLSMRMAEFIGTRLAE
jgi:lysophospholipase L1-like esterase